MSSRRRMKLRQQVSLIENGKDLKVVCRELTRHPYFGLDIETTMDSKPTICLIQLATEDENFVIDALRISAVRSIRKVLESDRIIKVVHSHYERTVFHNHGIELINSFDTMRASRLIHGYWCRGGHGLKAVCNRELGISLDKQYQTADWTRRPLTKAMIHYAALDAEVLLPLFNKFKSKMGNTT